MLNYLIDFTLDVGLSIYESHSRQLLELTSEPLLGRIVQALSGHGVDHLVHELGESSVGLWTAVSAWRWRTSRRAR